MGLVLGAWDLERFAGLTGHPHYPLFVEARRQISELSQLRVFNQWMGTSLQSLDQIPYDTIELVMRWAAQEQKA